MNCGAELHAKFCHVCGQREQRLVVSIFVFIVELIEGVFDLDSKLWRTLWPLFAKPGYLTKSFMEGKRERYLPPVRLYLISSIVFFLIISLSPQNLVNNLENAVESYRGDESSVFARGLDTPLNAKAFKALADIGEEISDETDSDLFVINLDGLGEEDDTANQQEPSSEQDDITTLDDRELASVDSSSANRDSSDSGDSNKANALSTDETSAAENTVSNDGGKKDTEQSDNAPEEQESESTESEDDADMSVRCEELRDAEYSSSTEFLRAPVVRMCKSVSTVRGLFDFIGELIDSLPKTLLVLIPLMAIVNKLLYLFSRRYYVEHLLYYVHNYSFLFLFTVLLTGLAKLASYAGLGDTVSNILFPVGFFYTIYYFFKSMRVVYGQGFFFTFAKWTALMITFVLLVSLIIVFFTLATAAVHAI